MLGRGICLDDIFYAFDFAVVACTRDDMTVDASANANICSYAGSAFGMDSGMTVVDCLRDLGPWSF